jgi:transcription elongation factor GreA
MDRFPMTKQSYDALEKELIQLKTVERHAVIKMIAEARALGDLSENAEYHSAKEKQGFIEGRIKELQVKTTLAQVIDPTTLSGDRIVFGATIELLDENTDQESTYKIVGADEADVSKGLLSIASPLARALIGKTVGASVEVVTPGGIKSYEILDLKFV